MRTFFNSWPSAGGAIIETERVSAVIRTKIRPIMVFLSSMHFRSLACWLKGREHRNNYLSAVEGNYEGNTRARRRGTRPRFSRRPGCPQETVARYQVFRVFLKNSIVRSHASFAALPS